MDERQHRDQGEQAGASGREASAAWEVEHRLARIEALLLADLDKLGEAVLGAAVSRLDASISALVARIDEVGAPSRPGTPSLPPPSAVSGSEFAALHRRFDELAARLDDLAARLDGPGSGEAP